MTQLWLWRVAASAMLAGLVWALAGLDWAPVLPSWRFLLTAMGRSWLLAAIAMVIGGAVAVPLAAMRVYGPGWLGRTAAFVVEAIRMTPELMIVFWVYFAAPVLTGGSIAAWDAAVWSLVLIAASHLAEVIRGGLLAVPAGQAEAAEALGLGPVRAFALVILPQALRAMVPALVAQFVALFKTTSLVYAIGVMEFFRAVNVTNNAIYDPYALYTLLALGYFVSCWAITLVIRRLDPTYIGSRS
jgi:polar amino acid transport system permease protein